jgi:hypothetical protein
MKRRSVSLPLLVVAASLLAVASASCSDLTGSAALMTSLPGDTTTSVSALAPLPGEPTTAAPPAGGTATTAGPSPTAAPPATHRTATTTSAPTAPYFPPYVPTIRVEDGYGGLAWAGLWVPVGDPSDSGGSSRYAQNAGDSMKVYFNGTSISFIARKGPAVGYARLELDGVSQPVIDLYNPSWVYQQQMWSSGTLGPGDHTLKVIVVGDSNPSSAARGIYVDAFDIQGSAL